MSTTREEARKLIADAREWPRDMGEGRLMNDLADALEALLEPPTDTTDWEYEVTYAPARRTPLVDGYRLRASSGGKLSLEQAKEWASVVDKPVVRRRTKAVPAGEWEVVPDGE